MMGKGQCAHIACAEYVQRAPVRCGGDQPLPQDIQRISAGCAHLVALDHRTSLRRQGIKHRIPHNVKATDNESLATIRPAITETPWGSGRDPYTQQPSSSNHVSHPAKRLLKRYGDLRYSGDLACQHQEPTQHAAYDICTRSSVAYQRSSGTAHGWAHNGRSCCGHH